MMPSMLLGKRCRAAASGLLVLGLASCAAVKVPEPAAENAVRLVTTDADTFGRRGPLTPQEMRMARVAWQYFERDFQPQTGLVSSVDNYPTMSLWDTASYLGALIAAVELGIIEASTFDARLAQLLATLSELSFCRDELPNKVYNTQTLEEVDYTNQPGEIGFSALDRGRLLILLKITKERYPAHRDAVDRFVLRWNFCNVVTDGQMFGAAVGPNGRTRYLQEGRLGYEEYAAKGFRLWGFDPYVAVQAEPVAHIELFGVEIPYDARDPRRTNAHNYVVTESYVLDAIELNWDHPDDRSLDHTLHSDPMMVDFGQRTYTVQERRHAATGILTARTEHQLDGPPFFVYDTIFSDGYPWNTLTEAGQVVPEFAAVAVKGAIGLRAIWETPYTDLLFEAIAEAYDPERGFYEGLYEDGRGRIDTFTANNNGILLETLLHKVQGELLRWSGEDGLWEAVMRDPTLAAEFAAAANCLPVDAGM